MSLKSWLGTLGIVLSGFLIFWGLDRMIAHRYASKRSALLKESNQIEKKIETLHAQFPNLKQWEDRLKGETASLKAAEEKVHGHEKKILVAQEVPFILSNFKPAAGKGNPSLIQKVTEGPAAEEGGWTRQTFRLQARMQFREILDYLNAAESASPFLKIKSFNLTQENEGIADPGEAALTFEILHRKDPQWKAGTPAGPKPYWPAAGTDPFLFVQKVKPIGPTSPERPRPSGIFFRGLTRYTMLDGKVFQEGSRTPENFLVKRVARYFVLLEKDGADLHLALS